MVTRFYGVTTEAPPFTPATDAGWLANVPGYTLRMMRTAAQQAKTAAESELAVTIGSGAGQNALFFQLMSEPLAAQTISGTVTIMTRGRELAATDNVFTRWRKIWVVTSINGQRGIILAMGTHSITTTELGTTLAGYQAANAQALTSLAVSDNDRIVVELGYGLTGTGTTPQADMVIGGTGTDHANADADATGTVSWIEFSQDLTFAGPPPGLAPPFRHPSRRRPVHLLRR